MIVKLISKLVPRWIKNVTPIWLKNVIKQSTKWEKSPSIDYLNELMSNYQVKDLVNVDKKSFKHKLDHFIQLRDSEIEGYKDESKQRDLSIKFHWGHNHDFGDFYLGGRMRNNHYRLISTFIDDFDILPKSLKDLNILDIGCWTGGASLLLAAMGGEVVAIEEVKKYTDSLKYLKYAFNIDNIEPKNLSLYECVTPEFQNRFDYILFAGVLYHITDPILALRIIFNCLKDGGHVLIETAIVDSNKPKLFYEGPSVVEKSNGKKLNRSGWNWFLPSTATLTQMMEDVGFKCVKISKVINGRVFAVGLKEGYVDMMRSGLSVKDIY